MLSQSRLPRLSSLLIIHFPPHIVGLFQHLQPFHLLPVPCSSLMGGREGKLCFMVQRDRELLNSPIGAANDVESFASSSGIIAANSPFSTSHRGFVSALAALSPSSHAAFFFNVRWRGQNMFCGTERQEVAEFTHRSSKRCRVSCVFLGYCHC